MESTLKLSFLDYINAVKKRIASRNALLKLNRQPGLLVLSNKALELQVLVDGLERSQEFYKLVAGSFTSFPGNPHFSWAPADAEEIRAERAGRCARAIGNFFRRSGLYIDLFEGKLVNPDDLFEMYTQVLRKEDEQVVYLIPLDRPHFGEVMNFGDFQILECDPHNPTTLNNLNAILNNRVNEVFYQRAVVDPKRLICFFIRYNETKKINDLSHIFNFKMLVPPYPIMRRYTHYPPIVEWILTILHLYNWNFEPGNRRILRDDIPLGDVTTFYTPFIMQVTDDLLVEPQGVPDFSQFWDVDEYFSDEGEKIAEGPFLQIELDENTTQQFKKFVCHMYYLVKTIKSSNAHWDFLDIALGSFIRAHDRHGLDELLEYMIALEAILGERGSGVTEKLSQRIAVILAKDRREQKNIKIQFEKLYRFRCDIVHGAPFESQVCAGHIYQTREILRRILIWILHYLHHICTKTSSRNSAARFPTREEILKKLDLSQNSMVRLAGVPDEFPQVREWIKWMT